MRRLRAGGILLEEEIDTGEALMTARNSSTRIQTVVIGGGQAGLAVGYSLAKRGRSFLILDANEKVGDAWRNRWDSLRLFNPARYAGLPGMPFPARGDSFPTKEAMANYLELYAKRLQLPIQNNCRVEKLTKNGEQFVVTAGGQEFVCDNVIVAMSNYQKPKVPGFASELKPEIVQIHSNEYKNPSQLQEGDVLVVGGGNSAADIGLEVARTHATWMSGKESGFVPLPIESFLGRQILTRIVRFIGHHVLSLGTPIGRKARPKMLGRTAPLVRVKPKDLADAGVKRVSRVAGVRDGLPLLEDGRTLDVRNVVWCTGFHAGFSWIDLPIFGEDGRPKHERGVVKDVPGLYFVGLHFLYAMSSATLVGVARDAERVVKVLAARPARQTSAAAQVLQTAAAK